VQKAGVCNGMNVPFSLVMREGQTNSNERERVKKAKGERESSTTAQWTVFFLPLLSLIYTFNHFGAVFAF